MQRGVALQLFFFVVFPPLAEPHIPPESRARNSWLLTDAKCPAAIRDNTCGGPGDHDFLLVGVLKRLCRNGPSMA